MQKDLDCNADELNELANSNEYVPFDGFVNVNDIIKKRRELKTELMNSSNDDAKNKTSADEDQ